MRIAHIPTHRGDQNRRGRAETGNTSRAMARMAMWTGPSAGGFFFADDVGQLHEGTSHPSQELPQSGTSQCIRRR